MSEYLGSNSELVLRLMRAIYQFLKRCEELEPIGVDLDRLSPIKDFVQATYIAIGVPPDATGDDLDKSDTVLWDWGAVLYGLFDETNGSDKAFLKIADKLREDYRRGLLELEQEKSEDWNDD